jgi:leucyl-tRNA synthetase
MSKRNLSGDIDSLCGSIRYQLMAMGPQDDDASWYKDNAHRIDVVLDKVEALLDLIDLQKEDK